MIKIAVALGALILCSLAPAKAMPVTWTFEGKVTWSYVPDGDSRTIPENYGKTVSGSITFDLNSAQQCEVNSVGARHTCFSPASGSSQFANASDGTNNVTVGISPQAVGKVGVYKGSENATYNTYYIGAYDDNYAVDFFVQDQLGLRSGIFQEANDGLFWDQEINWFAPGSFTTARINYGFGTVAENVQLDWITTTVSGVSTIQTRLGSQNAVPEPATWLSFIIGIVSLQLSRRFKASDKTSRRTSNR